MRRFGASMAAMAFCLAGCGGGAGNESAKGNAAANAAAPAGNSAAAPGQPCPFETRNIRAGVEPSQNPGGGEPSVWIRVEHRPDSQGRPAAAAQRLSGPPDLILDLDNDPRAQPSPDHEWSDTGIGGYPATPDYTHAVVRCLGTQIARVPIRR